MDRARQSHLDEVSKLIIEQLQKDGRKSYAEIGKVVGLSEAAVRQRVQKLTEAGVLQIVAEDEPKDFEFILDIEDRMVAVMKQLGRMEEAAEVERRLTSVREALAEETAGEEDGTDNGTKSRND